MAYIKCSNCGEIIEVPQELAPDESGEIMGGYPYFCDACESIELGRADHDDEFDDDFDYDDDDGYCEVCGGEGFIITCCDDICVGGGHCIHGDGEEMCPKCHGGY